MNRTPSAALLLAIGTAAARAQPAPVTRLQIDATGTATSAPDQLDATLAATASGTDPAAAQAHTNAATRTALDDAKSAPAVQPSLLGYDMSRDDKGSWTATSRLLLRSADGGALLALLGRLQSAGIVLESLVWTLSPGLRAREQAEATSNALHVLTTRAADAAAALHLRVDHIEQVQVSDEDGSRPRPFGMMRAYAAVAPSAPAAAVDVTVTASATVLLHP